MAVGVATAAETAGEAVVVAGEATGASREVTVGVATAAGAAVETVVVAVETT